VTDMNFQQNSAIEG